MDFRKNLTKVKTFFIKHPLELILLAFSGLLILISCGFFIYTERLNSSEQSISETYVASSSGKINLEEEIEEEIVIDIAGAIKNPGVYKLKKGSRLDDLLRESGGLTGNADQVFFDRNFNRAVKINDGEKYYIPSRQEVLKSLVMGTSSNVSNTIITAKSNTELISINSSSQQDLESLPGIGVVTAGKIISGRPYESVLNLISKKIIGTSLFEKIKDLITL